MCTATFLIFFQAFMVAPLIPRLADDLDASVQHIGLIVPAYMLAYGAATLLYGLASDRWGRRRLMLGSLVAFVVLTAATATAQTVRRRRRGRRRVDDVALTGQEVARARPRRVWRAGQVSRGKPEIVAAECLKPGQRLLSAVVNSPSRPCYDVA